MPPTMLIESLQDIRRRVKLFGVLYGAGIVAAAAVALLLAVVFLDWALGLSRPLRVIVNLAALVTLGYALWRWVVRPALARLSLSDLAGRLEHVFPQFDDSLRSTVNFMAGDIPGSQVMQERTVAKATALAGSVDLNKAVHARPVWYSAAGGLGALLLLVVLAAVVDPGFRHIAANRLFGGAAVWPKSVEIDLLSAVPQRVAVGQSVDVKMRLKKGSPKQAIIHYRYDDGRWDHEVMERDAAGNFTASLAARLDANQDAGRLQIRIEAGDDEQSLAPITVVPRLDIKGVVALVTPPAYAHLPASPVPIAERPVVTVLGSAVDIQVTFNKALNQAKGVRIEPSDKGRKAPEIQWTFPTPGQAFGRFVTGDTFKPNDPFRFTIHATDVDGFDNTASQEYQVIVHEDSMPTVQIEEPRRNEERTPDATVPLKAVAEDDYGISDAQLVVNGMSSNVASRTWSIALVTAKGAGDGVTWASADSSTERKRFRLEYNWDLGKLDGVTLKPGDVLEFFVRVKDNYSFNGKEHPPVDSGKLRVTIISHEQAETFAENVLSQTRQELGQIKKRQDVNKTETESQAQETAAKGKYDDAQRATVGRLATEQSTAASQAKQASTKLKDLEKWMGENKFPEKGMKETARDVAEQVSQTAEGAMKQATHDLSDAKDSKSDPKAPAAQQKQDAQNSAESMQNAAKQQADASKQLEQAMNKLSDFGGLAPAIDKIQKLKDEQEKLANDYKKDLKDALGKKPDDLTAKEKEKLKQLADEQDKLSQQTEKALNDMESKADKMAKMDPAGSKAMKEASQAGKQQGIPQKQSNPKDGNGASQDMQQNQQANAQNKHKEIDLGLEMILNKLKDAERRKLEELQKELAELQKLIGALAARQAGHNIDNLLLQDATGKKVTGLTEQERTDLFEIAGRELAKMADVKPELAVLTPSQEQTERNARDLARRAEPLPDPVPSAKLTAASSKMEQAIVYLRKTQLPDAYSPPQVEALKALVEAKKAVDEMEKKARDEIQQKNEEAIRAAYVKLLKQQEKMDAEVVEIDGAAKDAEGNLPFLVARRLGQLPGEQGKMADTAEELGKRLDGLGSIVYKWANKDIVTSMNEVKDDLGKPETGKVTQAEQKRIEDQLKAMIENLAKKPPEKSKFAQKSGGGGGKGGKPPPKMPTDVELRLLKALQLAVNDSTLKINAEKARDAHKLLGLGGRQGELRSLLDQLLQKASDGKVKLGKEPDNKDQLPEEASKDDVDAQELIKGLLDDDTSADTAEKTVKLTGDRMARSRQRLSLNNDPGKTTQEIQKRIVDDIEGLIQLAQKQQASNSKPSPGDPKDGQQPGPKPQPGQGKGQQEANGKGKEHQETGSSPAEDSSLSQGSDPNVDISKELKEKAAEWGALTPRGRDAVLEGRNEKLANQKYDQFVKDYYREVAKKASER